MTILLVDDSDIFRSRIVEILDNNNKSTDILEANSILEAKEIMLDVLPDILITDIRMPGGTGLDLIKHVRKENPVTLIIVITNYPEAQYKVEAFKTGANYFFDKSSEMDNLLEIINQFNQKVEL
jgi:DNA-binding NarL/FixJ family response regulator